VSILGWGAFAFLALGIVSGGLHGVDFRNPAMIVGALPAIASGLAGLCLHPPWSAGAAVTAELTELPPAKVAPPLPVEPPT